MERPSLKLQVMICTHRPEGLERVASMSLPRVSGVGYIVSCQSAPLPVPPSLDRIDVEVYFSDTQGLSNNRNVAISHVQAPYALIADDDVTFLPDALQVVIDVFDSHPDVDIAAFRYVSDSVKKTYPLTEHDLAKPYPGYTVSSIELALRIDSVRKSSLSFSPMMGIGAPMLHGGEEDLFLINALRRGLNCRFFPVDIVEHRGLTTGMVPTPGVLRAQGAYIALAYGWTAPLRLALTAWRRQGSFFPNLRYLTSGYLYAIRHARSLLP